MKKLLGRAIILVLLTVTVVVAGQAAASARGRAEPRESFAFTVPAGQACAGFDLGVEGHGGYVTTKEFDGRRGDFIHIEKGKGSHLTYTNLTTGATFKVPSRWTETTYVSHPNGTATVTSTGLNVLILVPTDHPAGPSTTLVAGRYVYNVDTEGNFTVRSVRGHTTDVCAALAGSTARH
jgi:hypothetical protein